MAVDGLKFWKLQAAVSTTQRLSSSVKVANLIRRLRYLHTSDHALVIDGEGARRLPPAATLRRAIPDLLFSSQREDITQTPWIEGMPHAG